MVLPGLPSSTTLYFSRPGEVCYSTVKQEICLHAWLHHIHSQLVTYDIIFLQQVYTLKHEITNVQSLMPGLILAIRKVVRLKVIPRNNITHFAIILPCPLQNLVYGLEKLL